MMTGKIPIPEKNVKFIINNLTPERILRYVNVEDRLRGLNREELKKLKKLLNEKIKEDER